MTPNRDSCEVYVESIAERRTVPYAALIPFSKPWQPQNRGGRSGVRKYVRYHGEIPRGYYGNGVRGCSRPLRCILPSASSLLNQHESSGYKNTVKRKCRNYSKDEKSSSDFFRCNINVELSSSKSMGPSNKCDVPYDLRELTSLSNFKPIPSEITAVPLLVQNTSNPSVRHQNSHRLVPNHNKNPNSKHNQQKNNHNSGESGGDSKPTTDIKIQSASQKVDTDYKPEPESRNYFSCHEFTPNTFDGGIQQNPHNPGMDQMHAGQRTRHFYGSQNSHHSNESSGKKNFCLRKYTNITFTSFRMAPLITGQ